MATSYRKQNRLPKYDYSLPGYYFVTICTHNKNEYLGKVEDGAVTLSPQGNTAEKLWREISLHYKNVELDQHIIMPNHIHGIIIIRQAGGLHYNLSKIVGSYKNIVAKTIHTCNETEFNWQPSFYDHVIRKDEALDKIREYIKNNPLKWELDRNNPSNLWM